MAGDAAAAAGPPAEIDTTVSHSARIWNYWLGGKDNYAADREAGDRVAAMLPSIMAQARADRAFLGRAIRYLAGEEGIRQFLDIGTCGARLLDRGLFDRRDLAVLATGIIVA
jgi:S-adenosyl methyltransferase